MAKAALGEKYRPYQEGQKLEICFISMDQVTRMTTYLQTRNLFLHKMY